MDIALLIKAAILGIGQSELPLELNSRYAGRLTGDQVRRPEPNRERCVRALHDGAGGKELSVNYFFK